MNSTSIDQVPSWIEVLLGLSLALQTSEYLQIRSAWAHDGIWRWSILRRDFVDFPRPVRIVLDSLLSERGLTRLLHLRLFAIAFLIIFPPFFPLKWMGTAFLFFTTLLIAMRWRGAFNGGSDSMTLHTLLGVTAFQMNPSLTPIALFWIALQVCLSFVISGFAKLKSRSWRDGSALAHFLQHSGHDGSFPRLLSRSVSLCWLIIFFEVSFPLAFLGEKIAIVYLILALLFHVANFFFFGLNRFLFAWAAAYPVLFYFRHG